MINFSLTALLPAQDVTGDAQTHLGAAHTHTHTLGPVMHMCFELEMAM
jgi:hypothetical protein